MKPQRRKIWSLIVKDDITHCVMSLRTKLVEVFIGDEYKNNRSAANALRDAIRRSNGVYPILVHERNNRLFLRRTDM